MRAITASLRALLLLATALLLAACNESKSGAVSRLSGETMGTFWNVSIAQTLDAPAQAALQRRIDVALEAVNDSMSTYRDQSELMRFNHSTATTPQPVSDGMRRVVGKALEISAQSDGVYDITVGPLVNLWGFGPIKRQDKPAGSEIAEALQHVGYHKLQLGEAGLAKSDPQIFIDLSSIAKGYGVDIVAETVEAAGYHDYIIEIGGEIRSAGKSPVGEPWRIAIEPPEPPHHPHLIIALPHHGLATSGGYRNFRQDENGDTHTHLINPRTLQPVHNSIASLSVIARTSMEADGLATGLTTLGAADALALARQEHLAVCIIERRDGALHTAYTDEFAAFIQPK